jgi:hypothetical protein
MHKILSRAIFVVLGAVAAGVGHQYATRPPSPAEQKRVLAERAEQAFFWHQQHDPYIVTQLSATGITVKEWVADGQPDDYDGVLYFNELGTGLRRKVSPPNRAEQAPDAKPQPASR